MAKFQLYKDRVGEYRWRFRADNGQIIADSAEGYTSKSGVQQGVDLVKRQSSLANIEDQT